MGSYKFRARAFWRDTDGLVDLEVWDDELTPTSGRQLPIRDFAKDDLRDCTDDDWFKDQFQLTEPGSYEILFEARLRYWKSGLPGEEEWDSEVIVDEYQKQTLPAEWFDRRYMENT